jgi:hypothetical protein
MMHVYVDESGADGQSPVFLFSALIAEAEKWAIFSDEWEACLKEFPSILYFKMDEAVGRNKQFYGFSETQRDNKLKKLCAILNKVQPHQISNILQLEGFEKSWGVTADRPLRHPYFFPFHIANMSAAFEVGAMGSAQPYEIFFDENPIFGQRAKSWYPIMRAMQPEPVKKLMPIEPLFRSDLDILPLQAADLVAWIEHQYETDGLGEFAWVDSELTDIYYSTLTKTFDENFIRGNFMSPPDGGEAQLEAQMRRVALLAYEETFGHQWPPKNKTDRRKMQGR